MIAKLEQQIRRYVLKYVFEVRKGGRLGRHLRYTFEDSKLKKLLNTILTKKNVELLDNFFEIDSISDFERSDQMNNIYFRKSLYWVLAPLRSIKDKDEKRPYNITLYIDLNGNLIPKFQKRSTTTSHRDVFIDL
jgi:hypothetical protein